MKQIIVQELKLFLASALRQFGFPRSWLRSLLGLTPLQIHVITEREKMTRELWFGVLKFYRWQCAKCKVINFYNEDPYKPKMEVDHIQPVSRWGKTEWRNLQVLCKPHNREKMTKTIDYRH